MLLSTGKTNARRWTIFSFRGATDTSCHEFDMVWEDFEGIEEDISKEAMRFDGGDIHLRSVTEDKSNCISSCIQSLFIYPLLNLACLHHGM